MDTIPSLHFLHETIILTLSVFVLVFLGIGVKLKKQLAAREKEFSDTFGERAKEMDERISFMSNHDELTGLLSRDALLFQIEKLIASSRSNLSTSQFHVVYIDVCKFTHINNEYGIEVADEILQYTARKLRKCINPGLDVYRLGGDEFVIVLEEFQSKITLSELCIRIHTEFEEPCTLSTSEVLKIDLAIGVSSFPEDGHTVFSLLQHADIAMRYCDTNKKSCFKFQDARNDSKLEDRLSLEKALLSSLVYSEMDLAFQPQMDLTTGRTIGAEVLLRWNHRRFGYVPPATFIPLAEKLGFISEMDNYALMRSFQLIARVQSEDWFKSLKLSLNISQEHIINNPDLVEKTLKLIHEYNVSASFLEFEFPESILLMTDDKLSALLDPLNAAGVTLTLNAFGQSYASLARLKRFPISKVKIDPAFMQELLIDEASNKVLEALIEMCRVFNIKVVGAGIESSEQLMQLTQIGCVLGQGYFLSKPLTQVHFKRFVESTDSRAVLPLIVNLEK